MVSYYYLNQPPGVGRQPDGFLGYEAFASKRRPGLDTQPCWGIVEYQQALSPRLVWEYELYPAGKIEEIAYWRWTQEQWRMNNGR